VTPGAATVWITGLPAAGKTTLAMAVGDLLCEAGVAVDVIDGDALRRSESRELGFSRADRATQARRAAERAAAHVEGGGVAVVALVSPYAEDRAAARRAHRDRGLGFLEVWMDTPLAECEARDPKRLYARARAGELHGLTGVDAPYEAPEHADVVIGPDRPPHESARGVVGALGSGTL
jgi:bifunctional enzyme CysN/CysC